MSTDLPLRHKRGGLYFEGFEVGKLHEHTLTRTVTQMDNMLFSNMTLNPQPLHIDREFCAKETEWGQPLMNSLFTLGLMIGMSVNDLTVVIIGKVPSLAALEDTLQGWEEAMLNENSLSWLHERFPAH